MQERFPESRILAYLGRSPQIASDAWVAPGASVIGDVEIGAEASIWYACVLRGDVDRIRIGERSNVQDGAILHVTRKQFSTEVGREVTIGHRAVVHGCQVDDGALIGIGAIVLDGARVGEEALVGAGAVVVPGGEVPPGTLVVGTPARVVRELGRDEIELQRQRTLSYVALSREHASGQGGCG
ncbi:MAG: gamma carbonic anhydrase family protein [bacterium]|nr:gamma carbonic anhydrase family protein [bacterium]MCP5070398.1 gamma carbonic anhydrase family protein [bacterium]